MIIKHFALITLIFTVLVPFAKAGQSTPSQQLLDEYENIRAVVSRLQSDNPNTMDYYQKKDYGDHVIMWKLEDEGNGHFDEVIRLYIRPVEGESSFAVTYHKTTLIVSGTIVLRKFVGPEPVGWRNDTVDYLTKEYLGFQGNPRFSVNKRIESILKRWNITLFIF